MQVEHTNVIYLLQYLLVTCVVLIINVSGMCITVDVSSLGTWS